VRSAIEMNKYNRPTIQHITTHCSLPCRFRNWFKIHGLPRDFRLFRRSIPSLSLTWSNSEAYTTIRVVGLLSIMLFNVHIRCSFVTSVVARHFCWADGLPASSGGLSSELVSRWFSTIYPVRPRLAHRVGSQPIRRYAISTNPFMCSEPNLRHYLNRSN